MSNIWILLANFVTNNLKVIELIVFWYPMPSLMHGSINAIATLFPFMVKPEYSNLSILGPAFIGIISMVPMLALAVIICLKQSKKQA